jgi:hypothetical protein
MEDAFWHKCWERNTLGFHQQQIHPFLAEHFKSRCLPDDKHVFVPLCGKTLDMVFYTRSTSKCTFRAKLRNQGKASFEDNGYSLIKYCNAELVF